MDSISKVISQISTEEERDSLYKEISLLSDSFFKTGEFKKVLDSQVSKELRDFIGNNDSRETVTDALVTLKARLDTLSVIKLTLAVDPTQEIIKKIASFIKSGLNKNALLKITVDPKILGGMILESNGLYRDYTLHTKLLDVFKNRREEIFKI